MHARIGRLLTCQRHSINIICVWECPAHPGSGNSLCRWFPRLLRSLRIPDLIRIYCHDQTVERVFHLPINDVYRLDLQEELGDCKDFLLPWPARPEGIPIGAGHCLVRRVLVLDWDDLDMIQVVEVGGGVCKVLNKLPCLLLCLQVQDVLFDCSGLLTTYSESWMRGTLMLEVYLPNSSISSLYLVLTLLDNSGADLIIYPCACKSNFIYPGVLGRSNTPSTLHFSSLFMACFICMIS